MQRRTWAAVGGVLLSLALSGTASAQFSPGARTLGDPYYVNTGNGGYDAQHYDLEDRQDGGRPVVCEVEFVVLRARLGRGAHLLILFGGVRFYQFSSLK